MAVEAATRTAAQRPGPVTLVVAGLGIRGQIYARAAVARGRARIVAIAEPRADLRARAAAEYGIASEHVYPDWQAMAAAGRLADAAIIATQDAMHVEPVESFAARGYHLLLEKPMAPTEHDSVRIAEAAQRAGVMLAVCHVLRYTVYTRTLKALLDAGRIGEIASVEHLEPVGWWHQAHSFVRGNWRDTRASSPMLLAKSCHDIDWLIHLMGRAPRRVSSFGSLLHFTPQNRPQGAATRCVECPSAVESQCPYSAVRIYSRFLEGDEEGSYWPLSVVTDARTPAGLEEALRESPYGECVYNGGNDAVDHQVVAMEFPGGATAAFTMTAFTAAEQRKTRIFGTRGCIEGDGAVLRVHDFVTDTVEVIDTGTGPDGSAAGGHGGGDTALLNAFITAVATGDRSAILSDAHASLRSHQVVWAAERARISGAVVELPVPSEL
jgi:predicted dehydrogenase